MAFLLFLTTALAHAATLAAQDAPAQALANPRPAPTLAKLDYPDSTSGLEHLVKDIIRAQKENDGARADALLKSFILPNPRTWYDQVFGEDVAQSPISLYEKSFAAIPASMARFFLNAQAENMSQVQVVRFEKSCDDNAGEDAFGILHAQQQPVPLYELRLVHGDKFLRLFAFAFVDGFFRFIITPKMEGKVFGGVRTEDLRASRGASSALTDSPAPRFRVGAAVQAAKLLKRVQPEYPDLARREHLQGTVKLHALIGKDGLLRRLYVIKGYCSLAEASMNAVSQWRYSPTILEGKPVEVDTEIDVIFQLRNSFLNRKGQKLSPPATFSRTCFLPLGLYQPLFHDLLVA